MLSSCNGLLGWLGLCLYLQVFESACSAQYYHYSCSFYILYSFLLIMKRTRAPDKVNPKKVCGSGDSEKSDQGGCKEPLQVFCRIRLLQNGNETSCVKVIPPNKIQVKSPETNRDGNYREMQYVFKRVFNDTTSQEEIFMYTAFDLVKNLIEGKNGLLFAYGITGSGKSYTMNGTTDDPGIMPRCLNVLFHNIHEFQTKKYVFKPDRLNGFDVQSEPDAMLERQKELISSIKTPSKYREKKSDPDLNKCIPQSSCSSGSSKCSCNIRIENVIEDNSYAVFVTYVEIYNNSVYDLMEDLSSDDFARQRPLQPKLIREDGNHNMYVHGVTEIEVKSTEEAFEVYLRGQKRRRLASTALNNESSRSHSVFTIRLVQAPLDMQGDSILRDRKKLNISQLSLVDLAGSERSSRTKTAGQRLREAGSINNSLLTLKTCLEILRENQVQGGSKMVPYRESRLTHLFKNYFDGEGSVQMIICVNPRADDYDETLHVLKFSEMSQEVKVNRPAPIKLDPGLTPGRRKANQIFKQTVTKIETEGIPEARKLPLDIGYVYRVGPHFPDMEWTNLHDTNLKNELKSVIKLRLERDCESYEKFSTIGDSIYGRMEVIEHGYVNKLEEVKHLTDALNREKAKNTNLEKRMTEVDSKNSELRLKLITAETTIKTLENEMAQKECLLNEAHQFELAKERNRCKKKLVQNEEMLEKKLSQKLKQQKSAMELHIREKDEKLRRVHRALKTPSSCTAVIHSAGTPNVLHTRHISDSSTPSDADLRVPLRQMPIPQSASAAGSKYVECALDLATPIAVRESRRPQTVAVANPRYRRSRSAGGGDHWLDHRPLNSAVPLNTIMQPVMKRRKSVTKLTDVKDVTNPKTSKYCLTTQTVDSDGDLETCLYKGDVIPTYSGGAQVLFNDMEVLQHKSPQSSPKKNSNKIVTSPSCGVSVSTPERARENIEERCAVSLEGHSKRSYN